MNNQRRKQLKEIQDKIQKLRDAFSSVNSQMATLIEDLQDCENDEQEYYDNMSEGLQNGEKGDLASANIECLSEAVSDLQEMFDSLESFGENAIGKIEEAISN